MVRLETLPKMLGRHGEVEVLGTVRGADLVGLTYDGPFDELPAQHEAGGYPYPDEELGDRTGTSCHRVIPWEAVTGSEGTGVVHIAPGCGREDFELGRNHGLVALSPLDEGGKKEL